MDIALNGGNFAILCYIDLTEGLLKLAPVRLGKEIRMASSRTPSKSIGGLAIAWAIILTMLTPTAARADVLDGEYLCSTGAIAAGVNNPSVTMTVFASEVVDGSRCSGTIVIPNGVVSIGISAFAHKTNITSIAVPPSVQYIKSYAFQGTTALSTVTFLGESKLTRIDLGVFDSAGLTTLYLPKSVTTIGANAFATTTSLTIYNYCGRAVSVDPSGLESKDNSCSPAYDPVTGSGNVGCSSGSFRVQSYEVVNNIDCRGRAIIPPGITTIGVSAFAGAEGLLSVSIPLSATNFGFNFASLGNLSKFTYCGSTAKSTLQMSDLQMNQCPSPAVGAGNGIVACSGGYFTIANFDVVGNLECSGSASVPTGVTSIHEGAFYNDEALTAIQIPETVSAIGANAFQYTSLSNFEIPNAVTSIGDSTFYGMKNLTHITIPANVVTIGDRAFGGDPLLASVSFSSNYNLVSLGVQAFFNAFRLTQITLPDSLQTMGALAFANSGLTSIQIPPHLTQISDSLLSGTHLTEVMIPAAVTSIGDHSFEIASLATITFENGSNLSSIGEYAFAESLISDLTIPSNVDSLTPVSVGNMRYLEAIRVAPANQNFSSDSHGVMFNKGATRLLIYPIANPQTSFRLPDSLASLDPWTVAYIPALLRYSYCSNKISEAELAIGLMLDEEHPLPRVDCQIETPISPTLPPTAPGESSEGKELTSIHGISGTGSTRTIYGKLLGGISKVTVNGLDMKVLKSADDQLQFEVPTLAAGDYDLVLSGVDGTLTWQSGLHVKALEVIEKHQPQLSKVVSEFSGFLGDSAVLTKKQKTSISESVAGASTVVCIGATSNSKVTQADRVLALKRARTACAFIRKLNPKVGTEVKITPSVGLGSASRKVTLIITK